MQCCVTGVNLNVSSCGVNVECTGAVIYGTVIKGARYTTSPSKVSNLVQVSSVLVGTIARTYLPTATAVSDFNPGYFFPGPEQDYSACAASKTQLVIVQMITYTRYPRLTALSLLTIIIVSGSPWSLIFSGVQINQGTLIASASTVVSLTLARLLRSTLLST